MNRFLKRQPDVAIRSAKTGPSLSPDQQIARYARRETLESFFLVKHDGILLLSFVISSIAFLSIVGILAFSATSLPPVVPLWYAKPWGEGQLVRVTTFILLPLTIPFIFLSNLAIGRWLYKPYPVLTRVLFLFTGLYAWLLVFTLTKIVFLVR